MSRGHKLQSSSRLAARRDSAPLSPPSPAHLEPHFYAATQSSMAGISRSHLDAGLGPSHKTPDSAYQVQARLPPMLRRPSAPSDPRPLQHSRHINSNVEPSPAVTTSQKSTTTRPLTTSRHHDTTLTPQTI